MDKLSLEEQEQFKKFLRDDNTFIVNDISELFAVLNQITENKS